MKVLDYDGLEYYNGLIENKYLPKSGGTLTGGLYINPDTTSGKGGVIARTNSGIRIASEAFGTGSAGAYMDLYGRSYSGNAGTFVISANSASGVKNLTGKTDGTLTWDGSNVITAAGGAMTGAINMNSNAVNMGTGNNDDGRMYTISSVLRLTGGSNTSTGSYIDVGSSSSSTKGVVLAASDGNGTTKQLRALYDGTLTWDGTSISLNGHTHSYLPLSGGTMTGQIKRNGIAVVNTADNGYTQYNGGKDDTSSYICIYGKSHSSNAGVINLRAYDGTNSNYLQLKPNGTLTWGGTAISLSGHTHSYLPLSGGNITGSLTVGGKAVLTNGGTTGTTESKTQSGSLSVAASTQKTIISLSLSAGTWLVYGHAKFDDPTSGKSYSIQLSKINNSLSFTSDTCQTVQASSASDLGISNAGYFTYSSTGTIYLTCYASYAATVTGSSIYAIRLK